MLISYRGELREPVACQVEMAVHTKALLAQMNIPTYHFHKQSDADELPTILDYTFMCNKPVAILTDATSGEATETMIRSEILKEIAPILRDQLVVCNIGIPSHRNCTQSTTSRRISTCSALWVWRLPSGWALHWHSRNR